MTKEEAIQKRNEMIRQLDRIQGYIAALNDFIGDQPKEEEENNGDESG